MANNWESTIQSTKRQVAVAILLCTFLAILCLFFGNSTSNLQHSRQKLNDTVEALSDEAITTSKLAILLQAKDLTEPQRKVLESTLNTSAGQLARLMKISSSLIALSRYPGKDFSSLPASSSAYLAWKVTLLEARSFDHSPLEISRQNEVFLRSIRAEWSSKDLEIMELQYSHESLARSFFMVFVLALLFEVFFVFRPLLNALDQSSKRMEKDNLELNFQKNEMGVKNRQLEKFKVALEGRNAELEEGKRQLLTAHEQAETLAELHESSSKRFQELFYGIPVACFAVDVEGYVREMNLEAEKQFDCPAYLTVHQEVSQTPLVGMGPQLVGLIESAFVEDTVRSQQIELVSPSGNITYALFSVFKLKNHANKVIAAVFASIDITENVVQQAMIQDQIIQLRENANSMQQQQSEMQRVNILLSNLATHDGLTGLKNHRIFQEALESELQTSRDNRVPLSLVLLDVDHFKQYNDAHGHVAGDDVLKRLGQLMTEISDGNHFVARYGGEEFVILLKGYDERAALQVAERYRLRIENQPWPLRQITASIGVATLDSSTFNRESFLEQADRALYTSKLNGRNRTFHFSQIHKAA